MSCAALGALSQDLTHVVGLAINRSQLMLALRLPGGEMSTPRLASYGFTATEDAASLVWHNGQDDTDNT